MMYSILKYLLFICLSLPWLAAQADVVRVAVASNFLGPCRDLAHNFEAASGHRVLISSGSTGKLYAQIVNGAPFDIFLAANSREPERLEREGMTVSDSRFTYARGKLVLWSAAPELLKTAPQQVLAQGNFKRLALANPRTAPYGSAAMSVLKALGLDKALQKRLVFAENIAQTYQFVATMNAELGFIARSQLPEGKGSFWLIAEEMHPPIQQQAVFLKSAHNKVAAQAFMTFLHSEAATAIIKNFGYGRD